MTDEPTAGRLRKAFTVRPKWSTEGDIRYAATAAKARYQAWLDWRDPLPDLQLMQLEVRRAAHADVTLPVEHRLVADLSPTMRRMLAHAYGRDRQGNGYRDHYCTHPGNRDALRLAWEFGLFSGPHGEKGYGETPGWSGAFFYLTQLGKEVAASMLPTYQEA
jgi:hypothetical protein